MSNWYVEDEAGVLRCLTLEEWMARPDKNRTVDHDIIDGFVVSTVLLGLDHRHGDGMPLIYETMVFDQRPESESPWLEIYGERYTYRSDALDGHRRAIDWLLEFRISKLEPADGRRDD